MWFLVCVVTKPRVRFFYQTIGVQIQHEPLELRSKHWKFCRTWLVIDKLIFNTSPIIKYETSQKETALKSNANNWFETVIFFPTCVSWHKTHQSSAGFAYTGFINYDVFFSKSLIRMFHFYSTVHYAASSLIKMYRVERNILTRYEQNSIKSVFSSVLVFCPYSLKVCIDISITRHPFARVS